ncbi:MAG: glycosyltransferase [Bacteroidetes bacterium]|nr:glycosyltransferase [Bacteroidota bacterium]
MAKFSIITINYNNSIGLEKTMSSVFNQTFKDFEYIVIDGGSQDGSKELIEKNASRISKWISEKDSGIYNAQNKGAKIATGEYCLFLNSGDYFADNLVLQKVSEAGLSEDFVYGDLLLENNHGQIEKAFSPDKLNVHHFMISTLWHPCTFIRREVFVKYGYYKENYKITADYEFFIRTILKHKLKYKHLSLFVAVFNTGGIGSTDTNRKLQEKEREQSWLENYSPLTYSWFKFKTKLKRYKEAKLA